MLSTSTAAPSMAPPSQFKLKRPLQSRPSRPAFSRPGARIYAVDTKKTSYSVARELAQARGSGAARLATDKIASDFLSWSQRAGIVAPKLSIADFDGMRV